MIKANKIQLDNLKEECTCIYYENAHGKKWITKQCSKHKRKRLINNF